MKRRERGLLDSQPLTPAHRNTMKGYWILGAIESLELPPELEAGGPDIPCMLDAPPLDPPGAGPPIIRLEEGISCF